MVTFLSAIGMKVWQDDGGQWHWELGDVVGRKAYESRDAALDGCLLELLDLVALAVSARLDRGRQE